MIYLELIVLWWISCAAILFAWKSNLFVATWRELYLDETVVVIESDDWGPGNKIHATRLKGLLDQFSNIKDSTGRSAVLTADVVLAVPDGKSIKETGYSQYQRKLLCDSFPEVFAQLKKGIKDGTLVPQLHGLEHLYGNGITSLGKTNDTRVNEIYADAGWWDWETLDSPLQGHYVNGTKLPTKALYKEELSQLVELAMDVFTKTFGFSSASTVAPCYLWDDEVEKSWSRNGISIIQSAGYRCVGRNKDGVYQQDLSEIRPGDKNEKGQIYLVRNIMYEPVDGKHTVDTAYKEAVSAYKQGLPLTISTHRYNFTRAKIEYENSLAGLSELLILLVNTLPAVRFISSPELGGWYLSNNKSTTKQRVDQGVSIKQKVGVRKLKGFLYRLWYRHKKIRLFGMFSGIAIPVFCLVFILRIFDDPVLKSDIS